MHFSTKFVPYLFLLNSHHSRAKPIAQGGAVATPCAFGGTETKSYTVTNQQDVPGDPIQLALSCPGPCSLTSSESYSVAVTVTVGLDLGLEFEKIVSAGVSASISLTTENGKAVEAQDPCVGPWTCGLVLFPTLHEVSGIQTTTETSCTTSSTDKPYTVRFPLVRDNSAVATAKICACKNHLSWADPGAPEPCPLDC